MTDRLTVVIVLFILVLAGTLGLLIADSLRRELRAREDCAAKGGVLFAPTGDRVCLDPRLIIR